MLNLMMRGCYLSNWQIISFWPNIAIPNYGDAFNKLIYISKAQSQHQAAALQHICLLNRGGNTAKPHKDLALPSKVLFLQ